MSRGCGEPCAVPLCCWAGLLAAAHQESVQTDFLRALSDIFMPRLNSTCCICICFSKKLLQSHTHTHFLAFLFQVLAQLSQPCARNQSGGCLPAGRSRAAAGGEDGALGVLADAGVSACEDQGNHKGSRVGTSLGDVGLAAGVGVGCGTVPSLPGSPRAPSPPQHCYVLGGTGAAPGSVSLRLGGQQRSSRALKTHREKPQGRRQQHGAAANPAAASVGSVLPLMHRLSITV